MKKQIIRILSLLLLVGLLLQIPVQAADIQYEYPNNWSRNALMFAVEHGIFKGNEHHDLEPKRATTRAEMAAILVRLLGLDGTADLSAYKDVNPKAWYCKEMSAAVAAGLFNGITPTQMGPNTPITREQAMTVVSRAFGLVPLNPNSYTAYTDNAKISRYARAHLSALQERKLVNGYPDGTVLPGNSITRAEVAQLIYNLFDGIVSDPAALPTSGRVLYVGTEPLPETLTLDGTLVLGPKYPGPIGDWTIRDELLLRCGGEFDLSGLKTGSLSCCAPNTTLLGTPQLKNLFVQGENVRTTVDVPNLVVAGGSVQASGSFNTVDVRSGSLHLEGTAETLTLSGGSAVVAGSVTKAQMNAENASLTGTGYAADVYLNCKKYTLSLAHGKVTDLVSHGLEGVTISLNTPAKITKPTTVTMSATVKGGTFTGPDTVNGDLICTLQWLQNGKVVFQSKSFGVCTGVTSDFSFTIDSEASAKLAVRLIHGSEVVETKYTVPTDFYKWDSDHALSTVQTLKIDTTLGKDAVLYKEQKMTNAMQRLPKGTVVNLIYNPLTDRMQVQTADGKTGWISSDGVSIYMGKVTHSEIEYSKGTVEGYVNQKGYASNTSYLIWVSAYTQRVFVFQGSKGNWKLIKTCLVSTGDNNTPTPIGVFETQYHMNKWEYWEDFYVDTVTVFNGNHAFHSILYAYDGTPYNDRVGISQSHGCIRMLPDDVKYIYNLPLHTRVVVY